MRWLGCLLVALLFTGGCLVMAFMFWRQHEPQFDGRSLTSWIQIYQTLDDAEAPVQAQKARQAVIALGTNSLPELVHSLSYDPLLRRRRVVAMSRALPAPIRHSPLIHPLMLDREEFRADTATKALRILGPAAAPALVQLSALARQTNSLVVSHRALSVLSRMNREAVEPLLAVGLDRAHPNRVFALDYLGDLGTNALPAIPALLTLLSNSPPTVRLCVSNTLARLETHPPKAVGSKVR